MSTINEEALSKKISQEITKYESLKKAFKNMNDSESTLLEKRTDAFTEIEGIREREKDNTNLQDIYKVFTKEMKDLENFRNEQVTKINEKILPATTYYISRAKSYKQSIGHYKDIKKQNEKDEKEKEKAKSKQENDRVKNLQMSINYRKENLAQQGVSLENDMVLFENERIISNKLLILHYIHGELAYHAKALEKLSTIYEQINDLEPIEELEKFAKDYKLSTIDKNELVELGYDPGKLRNRKQQRENLKRTVISQSQGGSVVDSRMPGSIVTDSRMQGGSVSDSRMQGIRNSEYGGGDINTNNNNLEV